jgi:hypothetical protein
MAGEADAVGGELVDVGCAEIFLTVAGDIAVTEVVGDDVDDVGLLSQERRGESEEE